MQRDLQRGKKYLYFSTILFNSKIKIKQDSQQMLFDGN